MISFISFILCILSCTLFIICIVLYKRKFKIVTKNYGFDVFEYDFKKLCVSQFNKIVNKVCPKTSYHGNFHILLKWDKLLPNQFATLYQLSSTQFRLTTENFWLSVYDASKNETIGAVRWTLVQVTSKQKIVGKTTAPFKKGNISAASGILSHWQNQNIIIDYRDNMRKIYLYSPGTELEFFKSAEYKNWISKENKI